MLPDEMYFSYVSSHKRSYNEKEYGCYIFDWRMSSSKYKIGLYIDEEKLAAISNLTLGFDLPLDVFDFSASADKKSVVLSEWYKEYCDDYLETDYGTVVLSDEILQTDAVNAVRTGKYVLTIMSEILDMEV